MSPGVIVTGVPSWWARKAVRATSSHMIAAFSAWRGVGPMAKTPWLCRMIAGDRWPVSTRTTSCPISSPPIIAKPPHGIGPPNSSAIAVRMHGISRALAAHAVA